MTPHRLDGGKGGSADYVRRYYQVPAYRGDRVIVDGKPGRIVGFRGAGLRVRVDEPPHLVLSYHPTWRVEYVDGVTRTARPAGVEWADTELTDAKAGTPLLRGGQLLAGYRDATFLSCPDARTIKQRHIVVVSHTYAVAGGSTEATAACDPRRIKMGGMVEVPAYEVPLSSRCRRPACAALFAQADAAHETRKASAS
ncbi:hypothetical protein ABT352_32990 [Streptosporangium sp. NPDC000563]|uniref:hypothetical protein n=1 Tax=Streptosporangium sp. NPDC000563 TaxID=3154366 RepID=UPI0033171052